MSLRSSQNVNSLDISEPLRPRTEVASLDFSEYSFDDFPETTVENLLDLEQPPRKTTSPSIDQDLDLFGNDDDLIKALDEDPSWAVVSEVAAPAESKENEYKISSQQSMADFAEHDIPEIDFLDLLEMRDKQDFMELLDMGGDHQVNTPTEKDPVSSTMEDWNEFRKMVDSEPAKSDDDMELPLLDFETNENRTQDVYNNTNTTQPNLLIQSSPSTTSELSFARPSVPGSAIPPVRSVSLRKRNDIQLRPYSFEALQFKAQLGKRASRIQLGNITQTSQDSHDADFSLSNTQAVDEPMDDISTQYIDDLVAESSKTKRLDSKGKATSTSIPKNTSSLSHASTELSPVPDQVDLEKYGLSQLILPPTRTSRKEGKGKEKIITFSAKKKGSRSKKTSKDVARLPSKHVPTPPKDIFAFDYLQPNVGPSSRSPAVNRITLDIDSPGDDPMEYDDISSPVDTTGSQDEEEDEMPFYKHPSKRKRPVIIESDENGSDSDHSSIFDFGVDAEPSTRYRLPNEDDIVPIEYDENEYPSTKKRALKKKKLNKNAIRGLPKAFYTINERQIQEEIERDRQKRKEAYEAKKMANNSHAAGSSLAKNTSERTHRDAEDVFAEFRNESQQSDNEFEVEPIDVADIFSDGEDFGEQESYNQSSAATPETSYTFGDQNYSQAPLAPIFKQQPSRLPPSQYTTSPAYASSSRSIPPSCSEAIEDNRIARHSTRNPNASQRTKKPAKKSSIAITKPANTKVRLPFLMQVRANPAPVRRKRKPKRTRDDIQIHQPYYRSNPYTAAQGVAVSRTNNYGVINANIQQGDFRAGNNEPNEPNNNRGMFVNDKLPRRPFDDIYMNTKRQLWYKNDLIYIGNHDISDYLTEQQQTRVKPTQPVPTIYTLQYITKQVGRLWDHELRRVVGLKDTVYWHHQLVRPLLSNTPNRASAYAKFKDTYSSLHLLGQPYQWKLINRRKANKINSFFSRIYSDLFQLCTAEQSNESQDQEIPDHDHFFVFVSICLTQWIPHQAYEAKLELTEVFANNIRGLAFGITKLVENQPFESIPWKPIIKTMLFILDWTCRLHHLGVDRAFWSVADCIQLLMDLLVTIGYDAITTQTKEYAIESWIFIIQILSVSSNHGGFFYNEHIFIHQMTKSINTKSRIKQVEFEKRKTTRLWAEALNLIMTKHMMLQ